MLNAAEKIKQCARKKKNARTLDKDLKLLNSNVVRNSNKNNPGKVSLSERKSHLRPATLRLKRLWHRCFPVNLAKFLRTYFFTKQLWANASNARDNFSKVVTYIDNYVLPMTQVVG